jgi:hypothetical protein
MRIHQRGFRIAVILAVSAFLTIGIGSYSVTFAGEHPGQHPIPGHCKCSVAMLEGTYAYSAQGLMIIPESGQSVPFVFAGALTFDGEGNLQGADRVSFGGPAIPRTFQGTYAVDDATASRDECAFTSRFTDDMQPKPNTINTYMVLARKGDSLKVINVDPGFVLTFEADKK